MLTLERQRIGERPIAEGVDIADALLMLHKAEDFSTTFTLFRCSRLLHAA
jgi:hypothetical protein